ncbi:hypothetical protein F5X99DRAFT_387317 [Biscogniauxia marginata]|nr:hypothetical protein F5X99DRAFT_387317 [Biscogniauxia marginata]
MNDTLRPLRPLEAPHDGRPPKQSPRASNSSNKPGPISAPNLLLARRATCSQCRIRKVRCDGRENLCQNCDRLGFECSFQQSPGKAPGQYVVKLPERRRRMQACIPCHSRKTRCHGELPSCSNCVRKNRSCSYPKAKKQAAPDADGREIDNGAGVPKERSPAAQAGSEVHRNSTPLGQETGMAVESAKGELPLDFATTIGLVEDYFRHLYPLPSFAFLHKPTVIQRCRDGTINEPLKLAICAIAALLLRRALRHDLWVREAERSVIQQIGRPSIFHLQALLLVVRYKIESGEFPAAFMLAALAARTAVALRLNYERSELPHVAQEARRRLFWSLYLLDDFFCVGLREFELCPEETIHLQLPCGEDVFEAGRYSQTGTLRPSPSDDATSIGLRGVFIRLTSARRAIMRFNRRVGLGEESSLTIGPSIRQFERELRLLNATLGPLDRYSVTNLTSCKWQAQFVMLHMSWHQCHCDLYRMLLNDYGEAAPVRILVGVHPRDRISMQLKCLEHAEEIIRVVSDFTNHGDANCLLERDAAVCAFESARLVMFGARLPGAASTLDVAINKARLSLHVITKFFPYSASTRPLKTDLEGLIASYSARLALQSQTQVPETPSEPDRPPRSSSKVSQYANSRQRLSVQSLLLQSDFADDSHEIAGPSGSGVGAGAGAGVEAAAAAQQVPAQVARTTGSPYHYQHHAPAIEPLTPAIPGGQEPWNGRVADTTRLTTQTNEGQVPVPPPPPSSMDAGQEDAGLIFNPWMGFQSGNEDLMYGLSGGLNEDY